MELMGCLAMGVGWDFCPVGFQAKGGGRWREKRGSAALIGSLLREVEASPVRVGLYLAIRG